MKGIIFFICLLVLSTGLVAQNTSSSQTYLKDIEKTALSLLQQIQQYQGNSQMVTFPKISYKAVIDTKQPIDSINVTSIDSMNIDVNLLITEQPFLYPTPKNDETFKQLPKRYGNGIQVDTNGQTSISTVLLLRTDRIGEFINRFNCDSTTQALFNGQVDFTQQGKISAREGCILSLCNRTDAINDSTLLRFAKDMNSSPYFIDIEHGSNYVAIVTLAYTDMSGKTFPVRLTLRQSEANHAPVWYIIQAESPYLTFGNEEKPYYIDYAEREIGFMGLARYTDRSASSLAGPSFEGDPISAFLLLTSKGFIKYKHSEKTQFVFRIGNYMFLVEKVESFEHPRSGYLITRLMKDGKLVFENRPM